MKRGYYNTITSGNGYNYGNSQIKYRQCTVEVGVKKESS